MATVVNQPGSGPASRVPPRGGTPVQSGAGQPVPPRTAPGTLRLLLVILPSRSRPPQPRQLAEITSLLNEPVISLARLRADARRWVAAVATAVSAATAAWPDATGALDQAAGAARVNRDTERDALTALGRPEELRGLLGADQARADALGAAGDAHLAARYERARDLLRTAPCDLAAADDAVRLGQQADRALARLAPDPGRRIELVDLASDARPRTF
jgi:hypothetical protein